MRVLMDLGMGSVPQQSPGPHVYGNLELPPGRDGLPYVYLNMAMTLDGKVTTGNPGYLLTGSQADRMAMDELRAAADAVMVGAATVRSENPPMGVRLPQLRALRGAGGRPPHPTPVVVSASANLPVDAKLFRRRGEAVVLTCETAPTERVALLAGVARVMRVGAPRVDLRTALAALRAQLGVERLLVEGGPTLAFELLEAHLVDELFITLAPLLKGGSCTPTLLEGTGFPHGGLPRCQLVSVREEANELFLRYRVLG